VLVNPNGLATTVEGHYEPTPLPAEQPRLSNKLEVIAELEGHENPELVWVEAHRSAISRNRLNSWRVERTASRQQTETGDKPYRCRNALPSMSLMRWAKNTRTNVDSGATPKAGGSLRAMRRSTLTIVLALAVAVVPTTASATRGSRKATPVCEHPHSRLLLADRQAEAYEAPAVPSEPTVLNTYGCTYVTGRSHEIGSAPPPPEGGPGGESGVLDPTLAGTVVAYAKTVFYATGPSRRLVVVRDLRTGRVLHEVPDGTPVKPEPGSVGNGTVVALVVKSDGAVAWIVGTDAEEGVYQVHALDESGSRVLATRDDIVPGSLALAGSTLYWTQGGQPRSATLN